MSLFSIKPTRQDHEAQIVSDLDALVQKPIAFVLFGTRHILKPVTVEQFFRCTNLFAEIDAYMKKAGTASSDLDAFLAVFHELVSQVCDTMTIEIVKEMSLQQVAALIGILIDQVSGKATIKYANTDLEKKKRLETDELNEVRSFRLKAGFWIAKACSQYGWTVEYCLNMPASQFFMMVDYVQVLKALDYAELTDIQAVSVCSIEYQKALKNKYVGFFHEEKIPVAPPLPKKQQKGMASTDGQNAMIMMFSAGRR